MSAPESPIPPAVPAAPASGGGISPELLETPPEEAREMAALIAAGHRAGGVVGGLTFVGLLLFGLSFLCWHFDRMPGQPPFVQRLASQVEAQTRMDYAAYASDAAPVVPQWPLVAQRRAHEDAFLAAGLALVIAYVFLQIERAKLRRQDLLVYRALAREIEKLRARVKELEPPAKK